MFSWRKFAGIIILLISLAAMLMFVIPAFSQASHAGLTKLHGEGVGTGNTSAASGTVIGDPFGTAAFTYSYTSAFLQPGGNGQGGNCDIGSGNITITAADGSQIAMEQAGLSCNTGAGPAALTPATTNMTYIITSGTGRFAGVTGTGTAVLGWYEPAPTVLVHFDGNIMFN